MSSELQIAANRRNAQLSTGPSSPEGKQAVRFNSLRHALDARVFKLDHEPDQFRAALRDEFHAEWRPETPTEALLVERLVSAQWRLMRLDRVEAGFYHLSWEDAKPNRTYPSQAAADAYAYSIGVIDRTMPHLAEHYTRAERTFNRTLRQLRDMWLMRPTHPCGGIPSKLALLPGKNFWEQPSGPAPDPSSNPQLHFPIVTTPIFRTPLPPIPFVTHRKIG